MSETNEGVTVDTQETTEETDTTTETKETNSGQDLSEVMAKLEELGADVGRLKRETKKTNKSETPKKTESDNSELIQKYDTLLMKQEGLNSDSEQELARKLQEETNMPMEKLLGSKYFKTELEELRTAESNAAATGDIKGDKTGTGNVKQSAEYWIAKGEYPTREQVSDPKVRKQIRDARVAKEKGTSGQFYNS